jgi:hypothetical protein
VVALRDEAFEIRLRVSKRVRLRHADDIEALRARLGGERRLDRAEV